MKNTDHPGLPTLVLLMMILVPWFVPATGTAQDTGEPDVRWVRGGEPLHEFSIWGGYAFDSFNAWGKTPNSTLSLFGARYSRRLVRFSRHLLKYSAEARLYAAYTYPMVDEPNWPTASLEGFGLSPIGFQLNMLSDRPVQPFFRTSTGLMYLNRPFPDERGTRVNFTFGVGGGVSFILGRHSSLSVGYTFFHLSNGEIGLVNPGIDSSLFHLSFTFF